jgi:type I restriction enzyme R subunit
MTLFKQIIGRGTRINEDHGKFWFAIMDFKRATELFADPAFDGEPVQIYAPTADEPVAPPEPLEDSPAVTGLSDNEPFDTAFGAAALNGGNADTDAPKKYIVGGMVTVAVARERVQYLNADGKLITESLRDHTRINLKRQYDSLDKFLQAWSDADRKAALIDALERQGVLLEALAEEVGQDLDPFDLLLHVAYGQPPMTRRERAARVKKRNVFTQYGPMARQVIDGLLDKYADEGIVTLESDEVLNLRPLSELGSRVELVRAFGGRPQYLAALHTLQRELYAPAAGPVPAAGSATPSGPAPAQP